ncbi:hypothetical protein Daura_38370 [Dactylosporangium aurantiacum]|uniref:Uncharacterized protein n=1 Tax=Dactylosporangium aurantiacum TaxID=35754 RepID=A0A9Q9IDH6_9ACTN|nr:hypothetical protein [Dactylosporangium aurantiacum]MDG6101713.1 hypothetical protein [Dactylosporangium aurantiacum]UWZ52473.1 hypothetical protein Daura_38370 [Dactylosporangium aurantiacum]
MTHFPGATRFDALRTYAAPGIHITTTWFATTAPVTAVLDWYAQHLADHERVTDGDWTRDESAAGARRFHGVTVHPADTFPAGPRPSHPAPPGTATVIREDAGTFPVPAAPATPAARPSLLQRIRARLITPR